jgi:hypothetical protein
MNFLQSLYGSDRAITATNIIEEKNEMIQSKRQNFKIIE